MHRQFLNCSFLSFLLISLISSMNISISSPSPPIPSLTCLLGVTHWKLGASQQACPCLWFLSGWWPSPPPKGWSSSPFCMGCSISSFSWAYPRCLLLLPILTTSAHLVPCKNSGMISHRSELLSCLPSDLLLKERFPNCLNLSMHKAWVCFWTWKCKNIYEA